MVFMHTNIFMKSCKNIEYIPIGSNCNSALILRNKGLRKQAYPFDWNCTPLTSAFALILNEFDGFMDDIQVNESVVNQTYPSFIVALENTYNILLPHHVSGNAYKDNPTKTIADVREMYAKRIKCLYEVIDSKKDIVFFFSAGLNRNQSRWYTTYIKNPSQLYAHTDHDIKEFIYDFQKKYPDVNFTITNNKEYLG
jgi:hypothetical protein